MIHKTVKSVTERIIERSKVSRDAYLAKIQTQRSNQPQRKQLSCGNLAHGFAVCSQSDKQQLSNTDAPNIAIVSAYNEMLSAHQPYEKYPALIQSEAKRLGATAQFAGGVPAMCDGVTQGLPGMELSLFSRDHIAMSTTIALSHQMFDAAIYLGICDKIVPGLLIGALSFGHLPGIFVPAGPMSSGISNKDKARVRQLYAKGEVDEKTLLKTESLSYHSPGTCTFYGTANSNQMLMEIMGLQLAGSSFENPTSPIRDPLTQAAVKQLLTSIDKNNPDSHIDLTKIVDEKSLVNGIVGLLATGGSTNHTIHIIAIARAAGIIINWQDMAELSAVVPLLCRVYPNGEADINHFHQAGGMAFLINELLNAGLLFNDVNTIMGFGLEKFTHAPNLIKSDVIATTNPLNDSTNDLQPHFSIKWKKQRLDTKDKSILRPISAPFSSDGGLKLLHGNLGRAVIKTSAVDKAHQRVVAPAKVFHSQQALIDAFNNNQLEQDFVAVVLFQGPQSNGMPELHKLTPILGSLQDRGFKVALVTDGRMSGASGKVPAAIHVSPEALVGGPIAKIHEGDLVTLDCQTGQLEIAVAPKVLEQRADANKQYHDDQFGIGRELFSLFRRNVSTAETGASIFDYANTPSSNSKAQLTPINETNRVKINVH